MSIFSFIGISYQIYLKNKIVAQQIFTNEEENISYVMLNKFTLNNSKMPIPNRHLPAQS